MKVNNANAKQDDKNTSTASPSKTKRKNSNIGTKIYQTITFQPAKSACGSVIKKGRKEKCYTHSLFFYLMDRNKDAQSVAVVIGGGGKIHGGSWLQKVMDDMVRREGVMDDLHVFEGTFYLCLEDGERMLNDEG